MFDKKLTYLEIGLKEIALFPIIWKKAQKVGTVDNLCKALLKQT